MWEQWKALRSRLGTPQHAHSLLLAVLCCHILNQIGVLVKLVRFSSNRDPENHIEENASGTQTQIILRFLTAVLSEACVYFEERKDLLAKLNEAHMLSSLQMNLGKLTAARETFRKADLYVDPGHKIRMAEIFGEMNIIIANGIATTKLDRDRILALNETYSLLAAELMIKATSSR